MDTRNPRRRNASVGRLRQWLIYKPLAALLAILLLPKLPVIDLAGLGAVVSAQQPQPQGCIPEGNSIIRSYCVGTVFYGADLFQLEKDAVSAYLALHNIPQADAHVIYDYGRSDLRNAIRGVMLSRLQGIFAMPAAARTPHEQSLYNWMLSLVHTNEINMHLIALNSFRTWRADPCLFTLDAEIGKAYNLSYSGAPYCFTDPLNVIPPTVPKEDYFLAFGLKKGYASQAEKDPSFSSLAAEMAVNVGEIAGIATATGAVVLGVAAGLSVAVYGALTTAVATFITLAGSAGLSMGAGALTVVSGQTVTYLGLAGAVAGPLAIIVVGVLIGIAAGIQLFIGREQIETMESHLTGKLNQAMNTPPDLQAMATDTSGVGPYKLQLTLVSQTTPEMASTKALPQHRPGTDPAFDIQSTVSNTLTYEDWKGNIWTAQTWGGWLVQTCATGPASSAACPQADSIMASIRYKDHADENWTGARLGTTFVNVKAQPASTDIKCPADSQTGITPGSDFTNCTSYGSSSVKLQDGEGNDATVSLSALTPPHFTSSTLLKFAPGIESTQHITALGNPSPTICVTSSNLPADITVGNGGSGGTNCATGSISVASKGSVGLPVGTYELKLTASGAGSPVTQTFSVKVATELAIISPSTLFGTAGAPVTFFVVATGVPAPKISANDALAKTFSALRLTLTDHGNGTATIAGTPTEPGIFECFINCGLVASNSQGTYLQPFDVNLASAPVASVAGCSNGTCPGATFTAAVPNEVLLSSTGAATPVSWRFFGTAPAWLTLHDNGNGSAALRGTPPMGATGTFDVNIMAAAVGTIGVAVRYPVTVVTRPIFTSPNITVASVGSPETTSIAATTGSIDLEGSLPTGLTFTEGNPATITGTPGAGTGGQYTVTLVAADTSETTRHSLVLDIHEGPQISSANTAAMFVGTPGSFVVTTTGYPSVSNHVMPANPLPPTDPADGDGMHFTVTGLPASLHASNLNFAGFATGTLIIQGTPSADDTGTHHVQITARNAVGAAAQQMLTLEIVQLTGPAPASGTTCNGNYNGTFKGSITVSPGQNCAFFAGGVTGNITVTGGSLALTGATITGNVSIQGNTSFFLGAGTEINGNLAIQNLSSASGAEICGTQIGGNLRVAGNASPIRIGSEDNACPGNAIGNNLTVQDNTGAIGIFDNQVHKNLSCARNTSINGVGNLAAKKTGQCTGF